MNKLMIIEPEPSLRLYYTEELMEQGFEVVTSDGRDLLDLIAREKPDLLVWSADFGEQEKSLMKKIRRKQDDLPVIFGLDHTPSRRELSMGPAEDYFIRSSDLEELKMKIRAFLKPVALVSPETERHHAFGKTTAFQLDLHF